jgi:thioredoxin 1
MKHYFLIVSSLLLHTTSLLLAQSIIEIKSENHLDKLLDRQKPTVLEFSTDWCGVCKRVKPEVEMLAKKYSSVQFIMIDGDAYPQLKQKYNVKGFPAFIILDAQGTQVSVVRGRNIQLLEEQIVVASKKTAVTEPKTVSPQPTIIKKEETVTDKTGQTGKVSEVKEKTCPETISCPEKDQKVAPPAKIEKVTTPPQSCPPTAMTCPEPTKKLGTKSITLQSAEQFEQLKADKKPMVLDFFTTWCGPCKKMKPFFQETAQQHPDVHFLEIDAERFASISNTYNVRGYPTFVFIDKNGAVIDQFSGGGATQLFLNKLSKITNITSPDGKKMMIIKEESQVMNKPAAAKPKPIQ